MTDGGKGNRLAGETSPYLLQHAHNPVDWYPWGDEALGRARELGRPIFLSIGYSACHWCHVMERESFEDPQTAELMNGLFVNIKVDREERPDLDDIYMKAVTMLRGHGGWPMSVFLTPELQPFFGGTYFPPSPRHGSPSFSDVLLSIADAWEHKRESVVEQAGELTRAIVEEGQQDARAPLPESVLDDSVTALSRAFDPRHGGFGPAPKFPHAGDIRIMLRHHLRSGRNQPLRMAEFTLERMMRGGLYDQLGGGFHRYSTDERWCIPHFEKMLYDNAQLIPALLEAHLATGRDDFAQCAAQSCRWVLREMITPEGGFASTQDADSEGVEGKFFAWTPAQLSEVLGEELGAQAAAYYDVTQAGNFEHGMSALWRPRDDEDVAKQLNISVETLRECMAEARGKLLVAREPRVRPDTDDKVLCGWNGMMIGALAMADQVLGEPGVLESARTAARYVLDGMRTGDGHLHATARAGRAHLTAGFDDYVFMVQGLLDLYEADFDASWVEEAVRLSKIVDAEFWDADRGGYFTTVEGDEQLIARLKSTHDGALPSGAGVHALNLLRLFELTGDTAHLDRARAGMEAQGAMLTRFPRAFSHMLMAVDFLQSGPRAVVVGGEVGSDDTRALLSAVRGRFLPQRVVALAHDNANTQVLPLLEQRGGTDDGARAFVCRNSTCSLPVSDADALLSELARV